MHSLITTIMSSTTQPQQLEAALDVFCDKFNIPSSAIVSYNDLHHYKKGLTLSRLLREKVSTQLESYLLSDNADTPKYRALSRMPSQQLFSEHTIVTTEIDYRDGKKPISAIEQNHLIYKNAAKLNLQQAQFKVLLQSLNIIEKTAANLNVCGPWMDGFFIHTQQPKHAQQLMQNEKINILLPVFAGILDLCRCFSALNARHNAALGALGALDHLGLGVFLVNNDGFVLNTNKEAQRILDLEDGIKRSSNQKLKLTASLLQNQLLEMIEQAHYTLQGEPQKHNHLMSVERPSTKTNFLISVKPVFDSLGELEPDLKCAFVTVIDPCRENTLSVKGLSALGALSKAESDVVQYIIKGYKLKDVAAQRDVSINTIKTQLKLISDKLRCSSQNDIIRMAAATNIPIEH